MPPHATAQNPMDEMLVTCPWCVDGTPGQGVLCTHLSPPVDNRCVEDDSARRLRCVALSDALLTFLAPELPQRIPVIKTASCEGRCYTVIHTSQAVVDVERPQMGEASLSKRTAWLIVTYGVDMVRISPPPGSRCCVASPLDPLSDADRGHIGRGWASRAPAFS